MGTTTTEKKKVVTVTDPKIEAAVIEKLITARIRLLWRVPFFGNLACRLELVNADSWLCTIATDGRRFYYNTEFVNSLSLKETEFGFGHEVLHNVYGHLGRTESRNPRLFNIAADYCVNADLIEQGVGEKITTVPILLDTRYNGWCAEEVYDDLFKNAEMFVDTQTLDEHLDGTGEDGSPSMSAEEREEIRNEIKSAVITAAQQSGAENLPAGVKRMVECMCGPVMDWRELLQQEIQSTTKSNYTWQRPARKSQHLDAILPGTTFGQTIDICVAADTSGSMSAAMLSEILNEVYGIMESYDDFVIHLWTFDTEVHKYTTFTAANLDDILTYEWHGGGGTLFECNWDFMRENDIVPNKLVFFTDGHPCGKWCPPGDEDYCDTVFIIHGNDDIVPPFGTVAYYDNASNQN